MAFVHEQSGLRKMADQLNFTTLPGGTVTKRERSFVNPEGLGTWTQTANAGAGSVIRFLLKKEEYLDTASATMAFDVLMQLQTGGTPVQSACFYSSAHDWITRQQLQQGSEDIYDVQWFNHWKAYQYLHMVPIDYQKSVGMTMEGTSPISGYANVTGSGIGTFIDYQRIFTNGITRHYEITLTEGIWSADYYLPMKYINQLTLAFYLAPFSECVTTNYAPNAADFYQISNVFLWYDRIEIPTEIDARIFSVINASSVQMHYTTVRGQLQNITAINATVTVSERVASLKTIYMQCRTSGVETNPQMAKIGNYSGMALSYLQYKVNSTNFPPNPLTRDTQFLYQNFMGAGVWRYPHTPGKYYNRVPINTALPGGTAGADMEIFTKTFNLADFANTAVATMAPNSSTMGRNGVALTFDFDLQSSTEVISGLNTSAGNADVDITIQRNASQSPLPSDFIVHVLFDVTLIIAPGGRITCPRA